MSSAMDPHDARRPFEGAPHQGDPAVLAQMGDRLSSAPGQVQPGDPALAEHTEAVVASRAQVHVTRVGEWGRSDEEDVLLGDELGE